MRATTEQAALLRAISKTLREQHHICDLNSEIANAIRDAAETIEHMAWIPYHNGENHPEDRINPLTCDGYAYPVTVNMYGKTDVRYYTFANGHWHHGSGIMDQYVVAWMNRPEPYEATDENQEETGHV